MKKFEYNKVVAHNDHVDHVDLLNKFGLHGWELVCSQPLSWTKGFGETVVTKTIYYLKREVQ